MLKIFPFFLILLLAGCQNQPTDEDVSRYHDDGRSKPVVAIVPVIETASTQLPWSVSEELTDLLKSKVTGQKDIFVAENQNTYLSTENNPFSTDINWIKNKFDSTEFAVL